MKWRETPASFRVYLMLLVAGLAGILSYALLGGSDYKTRLPTWLLLTALLAGAEYGALLFHGRGGRFYLSAAEAILLPMFMVLSFPQAVLGATVANAVARPARWKTASLRELFNVSQYGIAAAAGAGTWAWLNDGTQTFSVQNAAVAALSVVLFAALTHGFTSAAIAMVEGSSFWRLTRDIGPAIALNLAGSIAVGLLFAASYLAAEWMVALFPAFLGALFLGYRAVLAQQRERERVEHTHRATRALIAGPDLGNALIGFLGSVAEIVSAAEARILARDHEGRFTWTGLRLGEIMAVAEEVADGPMIDLLAHLQEGALVVSEDDVGPLRQVATALGARNLLAVPLTNGDAKGYIAALDRVGADEFGKPEVRMLEALADEIVLTLDSHRLFVQVAEERERFGRIFSGSKEGICLLDAAGVIRAWNPALESITGHSAGEVMGRPWWEAILVRDKDQRRLEGTDLIHNPPEQELELFTRTGPSRWVSVLSGPVGEGEEAGSVVLIRDVTAEHELEQAKSDFLSTISHELRTPLTTIKGSLQVLERGPANLPPDLADQMIGVTSRGAERLERLVMNLLVVSQIESGTMTIFPDEVRLDELARERADIVLRDHARVEFQGSEEDVQVRADRERLGQAIEHLLENARKFGGPDGEIRIDVGRENGYARVSVSDEGPGIPEADRERIFERFVRLGDVLTRETQGAGVGLFIAKRAVDAMQGRIWVEAGTEKGATFTILIPLTRPVMVGEASA